MLKLLATAGLATALAAPAFAQQAPSTPMQGQPHQSQMQQMQQHTQQGQAGGQQTTISPQELRQELSQAGFKDVQILESAYLVRAKTQQGHEVVMMINPPDMVTSSTLPGNPATGSSGQMPPSMSGGSQTGGQNR